jgi:hypothetical protein
VTLAFLLAATDPGILPPLVQKSDPAPRDYDAAWTVGMVRALVVAGPLILSAPWIAELFQEPRANGASPQASLPRHGSGPPVRGSSGAVSRRSLDRPVRSMTVPSPGCPHRQGRVAAYPPLQ